VLRRIFGPERGEVAGGWRTLYNEELHNLYGPSNAIKVTKSRRMRWRVCGAYGKDEKCMHYLVGIHERKRLLRRPRRRWEDNIKLDLREIG